MADGYRYVGGIRRGYLAYIDDDTNQLLIAEHGETYRMRPVNAGDPVPPTDGLWEDVSTDNEEVSDTHEPEPATETDSAPAETEDEK